MSLFLRITSSFILVGLSACGSSAETKESSSLGSEASALAKSQQLLDCQGKPSKIKWDEGKYSEICQDGFRKWSIGDELDGGPEGVAQTRPSSGFALVGGKEVVTSTQSNHKSFCASIKKLKTRNAAEIKNRSYLFESLKADAKDRVPQILRDFEGPAADARIKTHLDRILGELESCPAQFAKLKIDEEDRAGITCGNTGCQSSSYEEQ
jgi:hypothetical protein